MFPLKLNFSLSFIQPLKISLLGANTLILFQLCFSHNKKDVFIFPNLGHKKYIPLLKYFSIASFCNLSLVFIIYNYINYSGEVYTYTWDVDNTAWVISEQVLTIDFGKKIGIKKSSAQITQRYRLDELIGQQVLAVVNFPPRQIADFMSEVLVLGTYSENGVVLITPQKKVANGDKLG